MATNGMKVSAADWPLIAARNAATLTSLPPLPSSQKRTVLGAQKAHIAQATLLLGQVNAVVATCKRVANLTHRVNATLPPMIIVPVAVDQTILRSVLARVGVDALEAVASLRIAFRQAGESSLKKIHKEYCLTENPFFIIQTLETCNNFNLPMPEWTSNILVGFGYSAGRTLAEAQSDRRVKKASEAEKVGKALGFSTQGAGQTSFFIQANIWLRNRQIHAKVCALIKHGQKRDFAYDDVASQYGFSRSLVVKAFNQVQRRLEDLKPRG
jgi:hypothetical protein